MLMPMRVGRVVVAAGGIVMALGGLVALILLAVVVETGRTQLAGA
jgi:hypothetical protein